MRVPGATSCLIVNSLCRKSGQTTRSATRAGLPEERTLTTKPQLARQMLERAFDAGVPAAWVPGERVYGEKRRRRVWLEEQAHAYVVAVSGKAVLSIIIWQK